MSSLQGKVAIISGASRGLGLVFARCLARSGCSVANLDILAPTSAFAAIAGEFNVRTCYIPCDVTDATSVTIAVQKAFEELGGRRLDICIANAGVVNITPFLETTPQEVQEIVGVNALGVYYFAQACARIMVQLVPQTETEKPPSKMAKKDDRSIILIASIASHRALQQVGASSYCASKGAVRAMAPPLASELARYGIRVNSISPGFIRTDLTKDFLELFEEDVVEESMLKRMGEPGDLEGVCRFLASEDSKWVTGTDIVIDGGKTAH